MQRHGGGGQRQGRIVAVADAHHQCRAAQDAVFVGDGGEDAAGGRRRLQAIQVGQVAARFVGIQRAAVQNVGAEERLGQAALAPAFGDVIAQDHRLPVQRLRQQAVVVQRVPQRLDLAAKARHRFQLARGQLLQHLIAGGVVRFGKHNVEAGRLDCVMLGQLSNQLRDDLAAPWEVANFGNAFFIDIDDDDAWIEHRLGQAHAQAGKEAVHAVDRVDADAARHLQHGDGGERQA